MNFTIKRWMKPVVSSALVLTVALSGNLIIASKPAQAASEMTVDSVTVDAASKADKIIALGYKYMGAPYKFGAKTGNTSSFDCSSLMEYIYGKYGINLPRTSKAQSKVGHYVARKNIKRGDLLFFSTPSSKGKVAHVGVYLGNGKVLHTYKKGVGVTVSSIKSGWWNTHYITARRVL